MEEKNYIVNISKTELKYVNLNGQIVVASNLHPRNILVLEIVKIDFGNRFYTLFFKNIS